MDLARYRKAVAAFAIAAAVVLLPLAADGVTLQEALYAVIAAVASGGGVAAIPNAPKVDLSSQGRERLAEILEERAAQIRGEL